MKKLLVKSPVFEADNLIPEKYTCDGKEINPPLTIEATPKEAKSLALILEDPDAPSGIFTHWIVWNIPPSTTEISENSAPGTEGLNSSRRQGYSSPCPPSGTHRYIFKVYALEVQLGLAARSSRADLEKAIQGHILAKGELTGLYHR